MYSFIIKNDLSIWSFSIALTLTFKKFDKHVQRPYKQNGIQ